MSRCCIIHLRQKSNNNFFFNSIFIFANLFWSKREKKKTNYCRWKCYVPLQVEKTVNRVKLLLNVLIKISWKLSSVRNEIFHLMDRKLWLSYIYIYCYCCACNLIRKRIRQKYKNSSGNGNGNVNNESSSHFAIYYFFFFLYFQIYISIFFLRLQSGRCVECRHSRIASKLSSLHSFNAIIGFSTS